MSKKIFLCLLSLFLMLFCNACNKDINIEGNKNIVKEIIPSTTYDVTQEKYINNEVIIKYPQFTSLDTNYNNVNKIIKDEALKILDNYLDNEKYSLEVDYEVFIEGNLLSIRYFGISYLNGAPYPENIFYTTNINLDKEKILLINDIIIINIDFIEKFRKGIYKSRDIAENELATEIQYLISSYTNDELIEMLNSNTTEFYFTQDSLGISIKVLHALGDHAEIEIKYTDIENNITQNEIWAQLNNNKDIAKEVKQPENAIKMYNLDQVKEFICRSENVLCEIHTFDEDIQLGSLGSEETTIMRLVPPYDNPEELKEKLEDYFIGDAFDYALFLRHIVKVNDVYGSYYLSEDYHWFFDENKNFEIISQEENYIKVKVPYTSEHDEDINYAQYEIEKKDGSLKIFKISIPTYDNYYEYYKDRIESELIIY